MTNDMRNLDLPERENIIISYCELVTVFTPIQFEDQDRLDSVSHSQPMFAGYNLYLLDSASKPVHHYLVDARHEVVLQRVKRTFKKDTAASQTTFIARSYYLDFTNQCRY